MPEWIVLLRGINVGGRHKLKMKELAALLEEEGLQDVRTYIQSGNVVLRADETEAQVLGERIADAIEREHGFRPSVHALTVEELQQAMATNPYAEGESNPKTLHLFFLAAPPPNPDFERMEAAKAPSEQFHLKERVFYFYAPDGIGRSKLAGKIERLLGVGATARNWRTVQKLQEMVERSARSESEKG